MGKLLFPSVQRSSLSPDWDRNGSSQNQNPNIRKVLVREMWLSFGEFLFCLVFIYACIKLCLGFDILGNYNIVVIISTTALDMSMKH